MENNGMDAQATQALALSLLLTASVPLLPPGWQIARDPATGKFYFYNTTTGVVQWEPPGITDTAGAAGAGATGANGEAIAGGPGSAASALIGAGKRRLEDGTPALSAAGVLLAGAGGSGGGHHSEKRARLGEGRQSDFEEEVVSKLQMWCGEPTTWNTKKKVIEAFKTSPMWAQWVKAGHNEQKLVNFINRLKIKHLEDGHNKDTGAGVSEFEAEVVEKLNQWCGETSNWNTKKKILDNFKEAPFWTKWTAAGHSEQKMVNLINRLKIRHTEEAAKGTAAAAAALAAANGTAPPVITGIVGAVGGVSAFESEVVAHLSSICGEASTWNTKKKVIDAFKASIMWDSWCTAGHNEQKLVNFINRLKIKHLEEGGGSGTGGGGVSSFEPEVVKQLAVICGANASCWNTKKNVMDALKASPLWSSAPGSWSTTGHTEQQLVNFINRLKMKHLKDDPLPLALPVPPAGSSAPTAQSLAAAAALYSAMQGFNSEIQIPLEAPKAPGGDVDPNGSDEAAKAAAESAAAAAAAANSAAVAALTAVAAQEAPRSQELPKETPKSPEKYKMDEMGAAALSAAVAALSQIPPVMASVTDAEAEANSAAVAALTASSALTSDALPPQV